MALLRNPVISAQVNLEECPQNCREAKPNDQITLGDMYGNAMNLIFKLMTEGVLELEKQGDYAELLRIYKKPIDDIEKQDLEQFSKIIQCMKVHPAHVRLIGDVLADRGNNDYFTLKVIEKLYDENVSLEILLSNHDQVFLEHFFRREYQVNKAIPFQYQSFTNLGTLIENELIAHEEIESILDKIYLPRLRAISYTVVPDSKPEEMTIYTHAPVGLETIHAAAEYYKIEYKDANVKELGNTIDRINEAVLGDIIKDPSLSRHFKNESQLDDVPIEHPIVRLMWNRGRFNSVDFEFTHPTILLRFVHGHDGVIEDYYKTVCPGSNKVPPTQSYYSNMINLDGLLGKTKDHMRGDYYALRSQETSNKLVTQVVFELWIMLNKLIEKIVDEDTESDKQSEESYVTCIPSEQEERDKLSPFVFEEEDEKSCYAIELREMVSDSTKSASERLIEAEKFIKREDVKAHIKKEFALWEDISKKLGFIKSRGRRFSMTLFEEKQPEDAAQVGSEALQKRSKTGGKS